MPDAFFVSNKVRKRKRSSKAKSNDSGKQVNGKGRPLDEKSRRRKDEELDSDATQSDLDDDLVARRGSGSDAGPSGEEDELETPGQKRLRLTKLYLDGLKEELADGEVDAAELDREIIASRLRQDVMEHSGKMHKFIAESLVIPDSPAYLRTRGHREAVTAAVASASGKYLFTSGKEGKIVRTDLSTGKPVSTFYKLRQPQPGEGKGKGKASAEIHGHTDEVLALALCDDGKILASGGKDRKVVVWDAEKGEWLRNFSAHKDTVSSLAFRKGTKQLYTGSLDRTIKIFDLSPNVMGYVDTHFGHQDHVVGLDVLRAETAVSVGARDRTLRFWKITENAQLVLRGGGKSKVREILEGGLEDGLEEEDGVDREESGASVSRRQKKEKETEKRYEEGSLDCVAMVDESTFVSGGDSGSISIWTPTKKKPIYTQPLAHGLEETHSETEGLIFTPRWITALACVRYGDVLVSGSWAGDVRLWRIDVNGDFEKNNDSKNISNKSKTKARSLSLTLVGTLAAPGIVNSLQILLVPKSTTDSWQWLASKKRKTDGGLASDAVRQNGLHANGEVPRTGVVKGKQEKDSVVVIVGLGREPRLGRWLTVKGNGAANGSRVFVLEQK